MGRELEKYIKSSLRNGVNEQTLRYNLEAAGWSQDQINKGFAKAKRNNSKVVLGLFVTVLIIALGTSFAFFYSSLTNIGTHTNGVAELSSCEILPNGEVKIDCYSQKVRESYNCEDITSQMERLYCLRALENYYLQQV